MAVERLPWLMSTKSPVDAVRDRGSEWMAASLYEVLG